MLSANQNNIDSMATIANAHLKSKLKRWSIEFLDIFHVIVLYTIGLNYYHIQGEKCLNHFAIYVLSYEIIDNKLRGDGSGGARGAQAPPQFFRLGGHRGAQSILITSSESVSSYSIVTWC